MRRAIPQVVILVGVLAAGAVHCAPLLGIEDVELEETAAAGGGTATASSASTGPASSSPASSTSASAGGGGGSGASGGTGGAAPACDDGVENGAETAIDCGGATCPGCMLGEGCLAGTDCGSGFCSDEVCCDTACTPTCSACAFAKTGQPSGTCAPIGVATDPDDECISPDADVCNGGGKCRCFDGVKNGGETGIDCGGDCSACGGNCMDNSQNNGESDVDCGGPCAPCEAGQTCGGDADCTTASCNAGTCCVPDSAATTCATACGNTVNNCGQPVDCGSVCVPLAPAGWSGPAALWTGAAPPPPCPAEYALATIEGDAHLDAPPAACGACACDAPTGQTCSGATVSRWLGGNCGGAPNNAPYGGPNVCANVGNMLVGSVKAGFISPLGGSCQESGGAPTVQPASFVDAALTCLGAPAGGGCGADVCAPLPAAPFGASVCVYKAGDEACPVEYPVRDVVFDGIASDDRGCTACTCAAPAGGTCGGSTNFYSDDVCGAWVENAPNNNACESFLKNVNSMMVLPGPPAGSSCAPSGGAPSGSAIGATPTTVCCRP